VFLLFDHLLGNSLLINAMPSRSTLQSPPGRGKYMGGADLTRSPPPRVKPEHRPPSPLLFLVSSPLAPAATRRPSASPSHCCNPLPVTSATSVRPFPPERTAVANTSDPIPDEYGKPIPLLHVHSSSLRSYPRRPPARTTSPATFNSPLSSSASATVEPLYKEVPGLLCFFAPPLLPPNRLPKPQTRPEELIFFLPDHHSAASATASIVIIQPPPRLKLGQSPPSPPVVQSPSSI
jgi:hypothetical protein